MSVITAKNVIAVFATLLVIGLTALFFSLGLWQLGRADEKRASEARINNRATAPPITALADISPEQLYRHIGLRGRYLHKNEILIDNVVHNGRAGYYVITPFQPSGSEQLVLVNRGWLPLQRSRDILPETAAPETEIEIAGQLALPRGKPLLIDSPTTDKNRLWLYMDLPRLQKKLNQKIAPLEVQLAPGNDYGYERSWPRFNSKVGMHIGYAIQWFCFSAFLLGGYLTLVFKTWPLKTWFLKSAEGRLRTKKCNTS